MTKESEFKEAIHSLSSAVTSTRNLISLVGIYLQKEQMIPETVFDLDYISNLLDRIHNFLIKYDKFFWILDNKFGSKTVDCSESSKKIIGDMKRGV